jgi:prepilin-type N-terminal cleavage/methylation domain-containing protein
MKKKTSRGGFSLLEVVIAMALFMILAMGIFLTTSQVKKIQLQGKEGLQAFALLEKEMSQLRLTGARNITPGTTLRATTKDSDGIAGTLATVVIADTAQPMDKFIRLRLEWQDSSRVESLAGFLFQE